MLTKRENTGGLWSQKYESLIFSKQFQSKPTFTGSLQHRIFYIKKVKEERKGEGGWKGGRNEPVLLKLDNDKFILSFIWSGTVRNPTGHWQEYNQEIVILGLHILPYCLVEMSIPNEGSQCGRGSES